MRSIGSQSGSGEKLVGGLLMHVQGFPSSRYTSRVGATPSARDRFKRVSPLETTLHCFTRCPCRANNTTTQAPEALISSLCRPRSKVEIHTTDQYAGFSDRTQLAVFANPPYPPLERLC